MCSRGLAALPPQAGSRLSHGQEGHGLVDLARAQPFVAVKTQAPSLLRVLHRNRAELMFRATP